MAQKRRHAKNNKKEVGLRYGESEQGAGNLVNVKSETVNREGRAYKPDRKHEEEYIQK